MRDKPVAKISVVIPNRGDRGLHSSLASIITGSSIPREVIVVDRPTRGYAASRDSLVTSIARVIESAALPAEARLLGIRSATSDYVLFLDSDQLVSPGLIEELATVTQLCAVIPEVSLGRDRLSRLAAARKRLSMDQFRSRPGGRALVAPRLYQRSPLTHTYEELAVRLPIASLWQHEDTLLFHRFQVDTGISVPNDVYVARQTIGNAPIILDELMRRSFGYGENRAEFTRGLYTHEQGWSQYARSTMTRLDAVRPPWVYRGPINWSALLFDIIRAPPYLVGLVWGHLRPHPPKQVARHDVDA